MMPITMFTFLQSVSLIKVLIQIGFHSNPSAYAFGEDFMNFVRGESSAPEFEVAYQQNSSQSSPPPPPPSSSNDTNDTHHNLISSKGRFSDTICFLPNIEPYQKRLVKSGVKIFLPIVVVPGLGGSQLQARVNITDPINPLCEEYTLNWGKSLID